MVFLRGCSHGGFVSVHGISRDTARKGRTLAHPQRTIEHMPSLLHYVCSIFPTYTLSVPKPKAWHPFFGGIPTDAINGSKNAVIQVAWPSSEVCTRLYHRPHYGCIWLKFVHNLNSKSSAILAERHPAELSPVIIALHHGPCLVLQDSLE